MKTNFEPENIETQVTTIIKQLGVPIQLDGHQYLCTAIIMIIRDSEVIGRVTKILYPSVAKIYNTTPSIVERCIREVIAETFETGNFEMLNEFFGHIRYRNTKGIPSNSEFIAQIADYICLRNRSNIQ